MDFGNVKHAVKQTAVVLLSYFNSFHKAITVLYFFLVTLRQSLGQALSTFSCADYTFPVYLKLKKKSLYI